MIRRLLPWMVVSGISAVLALGTVVSASADRDDRYAVRHRLDRQWHSNQGPPVHRWNGHSDSARTRRHVGRQRNHDYITSYRVVHGNTHQNNGNHYGQYKDHPNNGNHYGQYKNHNHND